MANPEHEKIIKQGVSQHANGASKPSVLFPIRLDGAIDQTTNGWARRI